MSDHTLNNCFPIYQNISSWWSSRRAIAAMPTKYSIILTRTPHLFRIDSFVSIATNLQLAHISKISVSLTVIFLTSCWSTMRLTLTVCSLIMGYQFYLTILGRKIANWGHYNSMLWVWLVNTMRARMLGNIIEECFSLVDMRISMMFRN